MSDQPTTYRFAEIRFNALGENDETLTAEWSDSSTPYVLVSDGLIVMFPGIIEGLPWNLEEVVLDAPIDGKVYKRLDMTSMHFGIVKGWKRCAS